MSNKNELLVAIINNLPDFEIAKNQRWYRIPVTSVAKWLKKRWPPQWLAFYQTKKFNAERYAINYYVKIIDIQKASRLQLFPNEPLNSSKSYKQYYKLILDPLKKLPQPIISKRRRRIVFIPTTWQKFIHATEINDLYDDSPLEDKLWAQFKHLNIHAERQEFVTIKKHDYALDFALYCAKGKMAVETDGDTWHANPTKAAQDNLRDNNLKTDGWRILRFNTRQIREQMTQYCIPTIVENINKLGGLDTGKLLPQQINLDDNAQQLSLFDNL